MTDSPNKLIPVLRHKTSSSNKLSSIREADEVEKCRKVMKNSFRIKKQLRSVCLTLKDLKIEGTLTKPAFREQIMLTRQNRLLPKKQLPQYQLEYKQELQTKTSTIIPPKKQSQKLLQNQILQRNKKTIVSKQSKYSKQSKQKRQRLISNVSEFISNKKQLKKGSRPALFPKIDQLKSIKTEHYFILEANENKPILSYRSKTKIEVASLTKIMTFYTAYTIAQQNSIRIQQYKIKISESVCDIPGTTAYLEDAQIYTVEDLFYGLMLPSGNDAAMALAKWAGSLITNNGKSYVKQFINRMNSECVKLELNDTIFGNPHGLPHRESRTTCEDIAKLCSICLRIPKFREVVRTKLYKYQLFNDKTKRKQTFHWQNTNKLLRRPGFIGIKTGITVTAGPCLASAYDFRDKTYIVIIAKSNKMSRRFKDTRKLLVYSLRELYENELTEGQKKALNKLFKNNDQIDSDYSEEEEQFNFSSSHPNQLRKRVRIVTQH